MGCKPWTEDELQFAMNLYDTGTMSWRDVGAIIGRSRNSCQAAVSRYLGRVPVERDLGVGEPIGLTMECQRLEKDAKVGSMVLREACMDLFQRTANRFHISMDDAMACHLGFHAPPRLLRSPYGTASALRRLAA